MLPIAINFSYRIRILEKEHPYIVHHLQDCHYLQILWRTLSLFRLMINWPPVRPAPWPFERTTLGKYF